MCAQGIAHSKRLHVTERLMCRARTSNLRSRLTVRMSMLRSRLVLILSRGRCRARRALKTWRRSKWSRFQSSPWHVQRVERSSDERSSDI